MISKSHTALRAVICCACIVLAAAAPDYAQKNKPTAKSDPRTPIVFNPVTLPILPSPEHYTTFHLKTSWIPGEAHKGSFRYQLSAQGINLSPDETAPYTAKLQECSFTLDLYDKDRFLLRKIPINFSTGVSDSGIAVGLLENGAVQMDLVDYQGFLDGTFNMEWHCTS